jgi:hypothetical protein
VHPPSSAHALLGPDVHVDGDRCPTDTNGLRVKANHVTHVHGFPELDLIEGHGHHWIEGVQASFDTCSEVHLGQDDPAENGSHGIGVPGHHGSTDGRAVLGGIEWFGHGRGRVVDPSEGVLNGLEGGLGPKFSKMPGFWCGSGLGGGIEGQGNSSL